MLSECLFLTITISALDLMFRRLIVTSPTLSVNATSLSDISDAASRATYGKLRDFKLALWNSTPIKKVSGTLTPKTRCDHFDSPTLKLIIVTAQTPNRPMS